MNIIRNLLILSILTIIIISIPSSLILYQNSQVSSYSTRNTLKGNYPVENHNDPILQSKIGTSVTSGSTTLTTDEDTYTPGEWLEITADSNTFEMNGSLEWQLESPIDEVAFDFKSDYQTIFDDPYFVNSSVPDWHNNNFDSIIASEGYLTLTEGMDADKIAAEIFYNETTLLNSSRYYISFDYMSKGENLLVNPSFETGDTTGWDVNSSFVQVVSDPDNATDGSHYAKINGTEGFLVTQNVTIAGGRTISLSVKATGKTEANYWKLRIEAYNASGFNIGQIDSTDSRTLVEDDLGYIYNIILRWQTPINTSYLRVVFWGIDAGAAADTLYTGWLDDCYLAIVPPSIIFSYWKGDSWYNQTITDVGNHKWNPITFEVNTGENSTAPIAKTLRFILPDTNSHSNNQTSYWFIDNFIVNYAIKPEITTTINPGNPVNTGNVYSTWFHQGYNETLESKYSIEAEEAVNTSVGGASNAKIELKLPIHQVYFGTWTFVFIIHRADSQGGFIDDKIVNITFVIKDHMNYVNQDLYILRGSTNQTAPDNTSDYRIYYEQETDLQTISPGDNVTLLGYLEANSSQGELYSLDYLIISSAEVVYTWNSKWTSRENITWKTFGFIPYNNEGETILDGNFSVPYSTVKTMGLNFEIPKRGIFGNITANLTITVTSTSGGAPIQIVIPIDMPIVRFKTVVIEENLPSTSYYITELLGGNLTLKFLNCNDTLEVNYPNRNITSELEIPVTDLDLIFFLDELATPEVEIKQTFHFHFIEQTVLWLDPVNPTLMPGNYSFKVRWNTPYIFDIQDQAYLNISLHQVAISGTFEIISLDIPEIKQGESKTINFTVRLLETGKKIGGLDLSGRVSGNLTLGRFVAYEEDGVYKIDLSIDLNSPPATYIIDLFLDKRLDPIGTISFKIIEKTTTGSDQDSGLDIIISLLGFGFFAVVTIIVVLGMFRVNKGL